MTDTITLPRSVIEQAIDTIGYYASVVGEDDQDTPAKQMQAALRAALAQQAEQGWQPIETAPKNGTEILMYSPPLKNFSVRYRNTRIGWYVSGRIDADDYWGTEVFFNGKSIVQILHNATHWMPLPEAPKEIK